MKIALYIEDGLEQIVLTPETETERGIVRKLEGGTRDLTICRGKFFECRGGWVTRGSLSSHSWNDQDESTMIVLRPKASEPEGGT